MYFLAKQLTSQLNIINDTLLQISERNLFKPAPAYG